MAEIGAIGVMIVWSGNFIVVKGALLELPPIAFTTIRFLLAAAVLFVVCRLREGSIAIPRRDVLPLAVLGAIGFGIYQTLWTVGLSQTTAGDSALLICATPIFTLLIAAAIGSDHLTRARLAGALVSFAGVGLVVLSAGGGFGGQVFGNLITIVAAALWAVYMAFAAPVLRRHSPLRMTAWAVFFGTLVMLPLGIWQAASTDLSHLTVATPLAVLYAGLISVAVGNVLQFRAVQVIGPARTTAFQFLVPALTVVLAAIFLHEQVRIEQIAGGIVIVAGILIARRGSGVRAATAEPIANG
jgi:drug/metabolite transporter (DMT)-like permease